MSAPTLQTERLVLRPWRDSDLDPYAALCADPEVMRYFPRVQSRAEAGAAVGRVRTFMDEHDYGLWAVEVPGEVPFAGFVGLASEQPWEAHFTPCVEVGWRLARECWGRGYASEGARAALAHGFGSLGLLEIVSFTTVANEPSRRVMEKLGMTRDPADDFDHPNVPEGHPIRAHVLYRISREAWRP